MSEPKPQRIAPIKLLGARRSLIAAGWGALIGLVVSAAASAFFWGGIQSDALRKAMLIVNPLFGLIYGPMLSLLSAARLVAAGFTQADVAANWVRLVGYCGLGGTLGMYIGLVAGNAWTRMLSASVLIIFMFVMIGGVAGVLVPGTMVLTRAARRRRSGEPPAKSRATK